MNFVALKRVKKKLDITLQFACKSPSTAFFSRPFNPVTPIIFGIPQTSKIKLIPQTSVMFSCKKQNFDTAYNKLIKIVGILIGSKKESIISTEEKKTPEEEKYSNLLAYFNSGIYDLNYLSKMT